MEIRPNLDDTQIYIYMYIYIYVCIYVYIYIIIILHSYRYIIYVTIYVYNQHKCSDDKSKAMLFHDPFLEFLHLHSMFALQFA